MGCWGKVHKLFWCLHKKHICSLLFWLLILTWLWCRFPLLVLKRAIFGVVVRFKNSFDVYSYCLATLIIYLVFHSFPFILNFHSNFVVKTDPPTDWQGGFRSFLPELKMNVSLHSFDRISWWTKVQHDNLKACYRSS